MSRRAVVIATALALAVGIPFVATAIRGKPVSGCARDGVPLDGLFMARLVTTDGSVFSFCSVHCSRDWWDHHKGAVQSVTVRDETTKDDIDAATAWFVRSAVLASRASGERIHAFGRRADAELHVKS